jgi:hypothetical protein
VRRRPDLLDVAERRLDRRRVSALAIARDAERWGAGMLSLFFAVSGLPWMALLVALDRSDADGADPVAAAGVAITVTISAMLLAIHQWATTRLAFERSAIVADLVDLPARYRANAEPRLQARAFDEGGWGFRAFLALPLAVALVAAAVVTIT